MKNCLLTQLKGVVNNDSLVKLDEMKIFVDANSGVTDSRKITVNNVNNVTFRIVGDGYFTDSTFTQNNGKTKTIASGDSTFYVSDFAGKIITNLKKTSYQGLILGDDLYIDINLISQNQNTNGIIFESKSEKKWGNIKSLNGMFSNRTANNGSIILISGKKLVGNIEEIDFTHIRHYNIIRCLNVSGSVANIHNAKNLVSLQIYGTAISGEIKTFLTNMLTDGDTPRGNTSISIYCNNIVTFNGNAAYSSTTIPVIATFDNGSITVTFDGNTIGTYSGGSWS